MKKALALLLACSAITSASLAQTIHTLSFNEKGELEQGYQPYVVGGDCVRFNVAIPPTSSEDTTALKEIEKFIARQTIVEHWHKKKIANLLKTDSTKKINTNADDQLYGLTKLYQLYKKLETDSGAAHLQDIGALVEDSIGRLRLSPESCRILRSMKFDSALIHPAATDVKNILIRHLLNEDVLSYKNLGGGSGDSIFELDASMLRDYYLILNGKGHQFKKITSPLTSVHKITDNKLEYQIKRSDLVASILLRLYQENQKYYHDYESIGNLIRNQNDDLAKRIADEENKRLTLQLIGKKPQDPQWMENKKLYGLFVNGVYSIIRDNLRWMLLWTWYTDGELKLDPLGLYRPPQKETHELQGQIKWHEKAIALLEGATCQPVTQKELNQRRQKLKDLITVLESLNRKQAEFEQHRTNSQKRLKELQNTEVLLYQGSLIISDSTQINWMRHHDARANYDLREQRRHPSMYWEKDKVNILAHNVLPSIYVTQQEKLEPYEAQSVAANALLPIVDALPTYGTFTVDPSTAESPDEQTIMPKDVVPSLTYNDLKLLHQWYNQQRRPYLVKLNAAKPDTLRRTVIVGPNKPKSGFNTVTYDLNIRQSSSDKSIKIEGFNYKVYKTVRLQPCAGFVYLPKDRSTLEYNEATQSFSEVSLDNGDLLLGVKIFPWKTNIESNRSDYRTYNDLKKKKKKNHTYTAIRGNDYVLNRFSFVIGVGVTQKPMNNWFGGVAYDIVPGLAINGGLNVYSTNAYEIENGKVLSRGKNFSTAYFAGLSVDPIVLIKSMNIFQPK